MEPPNSDNPKLPDMIMCGDHPSFNKTELEVKPEVKELDTNKNIKELRKVSPSVSRTDRPERARALSEHALRAAARARSLPAGPARPARPARDVDHAPLGNRALVQAALGSFRWPPYLLAVWVLVLVLTHVLHCVVTLLDKALPALRKFGQYFRSWTEETWKVETEVNQRMYPIALGGLTGLIYTVYFTLYGVHAVALWAIEPLCEDERPDDTNVTEYTEEVHVTGSTVKPQ